MAKRKSYHWIAQTPEGKFLLLYSDPVLAVHHERGIFDRYIDATAYARANTIVLMERPQSRLEDSTRGRLYVELGRQIVAKLDELYALDPTGVTTQTIMAHFKSDYEITLAAIRWIANEGLAQWCYRGNDTRKFLIPNSSPGSTRAALSPKQDKILRVLATKADASNMVTIGFRQLSIEAGLQTGSISHLMLGLRQKGYVHIVKSGMSTNTANTYRISLTPNKEINKDEPRHITIDDFAGKSDEEAAELEKLMWKQMGIKEEDLYPPEERAARFEAALKACLNTPPIKKK